MPYNGGIVSFDDRLRDVIDRALAEARANLEHEVRALAHELGDSMADERSRAAAAAVDELRRSWDASMAELVSAADAFDNAGSLAEVLHALFDGARRCADRVGIFLVNNGRLRPWRLEGLDLAAMAASGADYATFPIIVGGSVVAILYADVPRADGAPAGRAAMLDVLARHASRLLESMTLHKALGLVPPRPTEAERGGGSAQ